MTRPRTAIYARYSTDLQNPQSCSDQARECEKLVLALNGVLVDTYLDPEESGYKRDRPELERLLDDISLNRIDVVVAEAVDRIARDPEDLAFIGKKLEYHDVTLHTVTEGLVDHIKFAVAGLLGSIFLPNLRDKVRRGLASVVNSGRCPARVIYGYKKTIAFDASGNLIPGLREIDSDKAEVVRRVFRDFVSGQSSITIARALNAEGIPGPTGGEWNPSAIRGNPKKLIGVLNNPMYIGKLVWHRSEWRKNPDTVKRERRQKLRDPSEWIEKEIPELRIIDDELWADVQAEMHRRERPKLAKALAECNRRQHLLSGLIRCGLCGSNFVVSGKDYYRCPRATIRGTCTNRSSVRVGCIEDAVLKVLRDNLLTPERAHQFCEEYETEAKKLERTADADIARARSRLKKVENELRNLAENLLAGVVSTTLQDMLRLKEEEKVQLQEKLGRLAENAAPRLRLTPAALLQRFNDAVQRLPEVLATGPTCEKGASVLAELIEAVTVFPETDDGQQVEVSAKTATLTAFAYKESPPPKRGAVRSIAVVAGVGFEPTTFRL